MNPIDFIITAFWLIIIFKSIAFWTYLWQLKEYHGKRFVDHFRTEKGKKIFFNPIFLAKAFLILLLFLVPEFFYLIIFIYAAEAAKNVLKRNFLIPKITLKSCFIMIISAVLFLTIVVFSAGSPYFIYSILILDLFSVALTSVPVLFFWPITAIFQNLLLKKAETKRERHKNMIVVGIVGSYGKTTVKDFLTHILSKKFKVLKTPENNNSEVGIAKTILNQLENQEIFIAEIGAYDKGKVKQVCGFLKPKIGIVSGINEQHLSLFGSMKNLISAEGGKELIESLSEDGVAILNGDNSIIQKLKPEIKNYNSKLNSVKFCSVQKREDFWAENINAGKETLSFMVFSKEGESAEFKINLMGAYNVENVLLATACARTLGMSLEEISSACRSANRDQGTLRLRPNKHCLNIIDSTYSSNPSGVMAHLEYLKEWKGKKAIVMPCLIELGGASKEIHKNIGKKISEVCDLAIITTSERFQEIRDGAGEKALLIKDFGQIFEKLKGFSDKEDVIILEGRISNDLYRLLFKNE